MPPFVDPAADVTPIRFPPREPIDPGAIPHLQKVAALCSPRYNEVQGDLGCTICPGAEDFAFAEPTLSPEVTRGEITWRVRHVYDGNFSATGMKEALLATEGCEWRHGGIVIVTETPEGWRAGQYVGELPFAESDECSVARSAEWGDVLLCQGILLTHYAGVHRMRGSAPYAWSLTVVAAPDEKLLISDLVVARDPEACASPGARGSVVRVDFVTVQVADQNGDGQDDVSLEVQYLTAPAPNDEACSGKTGLLSTTLHFHRSEDGFSPDPSARAFIERMGLR